MAVLSRPKVNPQQRFDLEDLLALLSALRTDSKIRVKQFESSKNLILKGFSITGLGLTQATVQMTDATLIIPETTSDFSWFSSEIGAPDELITDAQLTDGARNYVEILLQTEDNTPLNKAFWDPDANSGKGLEFNQQVNTMTDLDATFVVSTGGFSGLADRLPLAIIDTDISGNIKSIFDRRELFFRLAKPNDLDNEYTWGTKVEPVYSLTLTGVTGTFLADEEISLSTETATTVTGGTTTFTFNEPTGINFAPGDTVTGTTSGATGTIDSVVESFAGADKSISDYEEALKAIFTEIKNFKGTRFWWQDTSKSLQGISDSEHTVIVSVAANSRWSWDGSNLSITDDSGAPLATDPLARMVTFGAGKFIDLSRQDGQDSSSTLAIADGEVLYIDRSGLVNKLIDEPGSGTTNFKTIAATSYTQSDDNYWLAYREGSLLYVRGIGELEVGESAEISDNINENILTAIGLATETSLPNYSSTEIVVQNDSLVNAISALDAALQSGIDAANQDRNIELIEGGTWSYNEIGSNNLILSQDAFVQIPGITNQRNTIQAQTIVLPNSTSVAYIEMTRDAGVPINKVVSVSDVDALVPTENTFIIARKTSEGVLVADSFALKDGEYLELDGALAELNRILNQTKIVPHESNIDQARILTSEIEQLDGSLLTQVIGTFMLKFDGAVIDFTTGETFEADGTTPLGIDFTPQTIPSGEYFWYGLSLNPAAVNALNQQLATVNVDLASASNASASNAPLSILSGTIKLGWVQVQNNGGNVEVSQVRRLGPGTGAGGSGTGFVKVDYYNPISTVLPTGSTVTIDGQAGINGDLVLFSNLSSDNNRVYELDGVGSSITWTPVRAFDNQFDPSDGDAVIVRKGDAFQEQTPIFNGTKFLVNDVIRLFDDVSGNFWEMGSIKTTNLVNNTTDNVFSVTAAGSENIIVNYSLARGTNKETGQLMITTNGAVANVSRHTAFIGALGVEFTAQINSGDLELNYETDNQGVDAVMKFFLHRWSNSAGGPTGVPSYSAGGGGSTAAAGVLGDIQYHGASGNLEADSRFKWDSSKSALSLDGLEISSLKGPINIADNIAVPTTLFTYPVSSYNFSVIEYSIQRGTNFRVGRILIANSSTNPAFSDDSVEVGSTGVSFTVTVNGGNVELNYLSTSTGQTGEFKYSIRQWA